MVFLVPFDGSPDAEAALRRAVEHGRAFESEVLAVSYVPTGAQFAERRTWIDPAEEFALETVRTDLRRKIEEATDETERVFDQALSAGSPHDGIGEEIHRTAADVAASVLFVGATTGDVGTVEAGPDYDIHVVRRGEAASY